MFYTVTIFDHYKNSQGQRAGVSWENFKDSMKVYAAQEQATKSSCHQISGHSFKDDIRRKANAEYINIAFIDVDNKPDPKTPYKKYTIEAALLALDGIESLIVTSWSHKPDDPRFRIMLPLAAPVPAKKFRPVMYDLFFRLFKSSKGIDSGSYKNVALPYYLPYNNAEVIERYGDLWIPQEMEPPRKIVETEAIEFIGKAGMSRYLQAVIRNTQKDMRSAGSEGRNNALNRAAYSLGRMVGARIMDHSEVTNLLRSEAVACGLMSEDGEQSIMATIESGLKSGMARPANVRKLNTDSIFKRGK